MVSDLMKDEDPPEKAADLFPKGWTVGRSAASLVRDGEDVLLEGAESESDEKATKAADVAENNAPDERAETSVDSGRPAAKSTSPEVDDDIAALSEPDDLEPDDLDTELLFAQGDDDLWASSVFIGEHEEGEDVVEEDPCNDTGTFFLHPNTAKAGEQLADLERDDDATEVWRPTAVLRPGMERAPSSDTEPTPSVDNEVTRPLPQLASADQEPAIDWSEINHADELSPQLPDDYDQAVLPEHDIDAIRDDDTAPLETLMDHQVVEMGAALTALRNDSFRRPANVHGPIDSDVSGSASAKWTQRFVLFGLWALVALLLMVLMSAVTVVEEQRTDKAGVVETVAAMGDQISAWAQGVRSWFVSDAGLVEAPASGDAEIPAAEQAASDGTVVLDKGPEDRPVHVDLPAAEAPAGR